MRNIEGENDRGNIDLDGEGEAADSRGSSLGGRGGGRDQRKWTDKNNKDIEQKERGGKKEEGRKEKMNCKERKRRITKISY